ASPRSSRAPASSTTPGCTRASVADPDTAGGASTRYHSGPAATASPAVATPAARTPTRRVPSPAARAGVAARTRKPTSHTPPRRAGASNAGTAHWLAPSNPHGPPSDDQDRTASIATQPAGSTSTAAANRGPVDGAASSHQAATDHGIHSRASSPAMASR